MAQRRHITISELGHKLDTCHRISSYLQAVSDNIARQGEIDPDDVIAAAKAGYDLILTFPNGYDSEIGIEGGVMLSPGLRQRLALARALYRKPVLVVLDEPNSNLDSSGEMALNGAIKTLKEAGSTVIIVSHRQGAMKLADHVIVVRSGAVVDMVRVTKLWRDFAADLLVQPLDSYKELWWGDGEDRTGLILRPHKIY